MTRMYTFGTAAALGIAALTLAGCQPAGPTDMSQGGFVTPAQQDQICLDAVKAETGNSVASVQFSDHDGGTMEIVGGVTYDSVVTVGVGSPAVAYHCLINNDGVVGDIHAVISAHVDG